MRDQLELPIDASNLPRFRLARLNPVEPDDVGPAGSDAAKAVTVH
jgi:hypothetical protein